mmetsp:Transcript_9543/g.21170  ORF Transcript_9543/g.21170 Transcript_9543/m.21170 type:complete len:84 (-) Transcript_9543:233-484(-)
MASHRLALPVLHGAKGSECHYVQPASLQIHQGLICPARSRSIRFIKDKAFCLDNMSAPGVTTKKKFQSFLSSHSEQDWMERIY